MPRSPDSAAQIGSAMKVVLQNRGRRAFTVVEVVISAAIIAVLAVLAYGAVGKISLKAKSTGCISNLRQIHMAFMGYAADNANLLPLALTGAGEINSAWMNYLVDGGYLPPVSEGVSASHRKHPLYDPGSLVKAGPPTTGNYGVNRSLLGSSSQFTPNPGRLNLATVSEPSKKLLLMCAGVYSIKHDQASTGGGNTYLPGLPQNKSISRDKKLEADANEGRHGRRINALYLSGNLESIPPEDLILKADVWQR